MMDRRDFMKTTALGATGLGIGIGLMPAIARGRAVEGRVGSKTNEHLVCVPEFGHDRRLQRIPGVEFLAFRMYLNTPETPMTIQELLKVDEMRDQDRHLDFFTKLEGGRQQVCEELQVCAYIRDERAVTKEGVVPWATAVVFWDVLVVEDAYFTWISHEGPRRDALMESTLG